MTISQSLAEFILSVDPEKMPVQAVNAAKTHFIDGMSCMFFGVNSASVKLALKYDRARGIAFSPMRTGTKQARSPAQCSARWRRTATTLTT